MNGTTPILFAVGALCLAPLLLLSFSGLGSVKISCSLFHDGPLDEWWPENSWKFPNITLEEFRAFPFPDGLTQIDGHFVNVSPASIRVGDILVYETLGKPPVIGHRVISKRAVNVTETEIAPHDSGLDVLHHNFTRYIFSTVGDNWFHQPFERYIDDRPVKGAIVPAEKAPWIASLIARWVCRH